MKQETDEQAQKFAIRIVWALLLITALTSLHSLSSRTSYSVSENLKHGEFKYGGRTNIMTAV